MGRGRAPCYEAGGARQHFVVLDAALCSGLRNLTMQVSEGEGWGFSSVP